MNRHSDNQLPELIVKEVEGSFVVWFAPSNQWVQMEKPAWFVYEQNTLGKDRQSIIAEVASEFGLSEIESTRFVGDILSSVKNLTHSGSSGPDLTSGSGEAKNYQPPFLKRHCYHWGDKYFSISYDSPWLENYIHQPFAWLEAVQSVDSPLSLELFQLRDKFVMRIPGKKGKCLLVDESGQLKHLVFIEIASYVHEKQQDEWMSFIHASALASGKHTILLSSATGSGKSTMAALLQARGFQLVSDDFVPLDALSKNAFFFPAAICLKRNFPDELKELYPGLEAKTPGEGFSYIVPECSESAKPQLIRKIVFIKYNPEKSLEFYPLSRLRALELFHKESWVTNQPRYAKEFIDWFVGLEFYHLEYGDTGKAIGILTDLLEQ
jgi:hypothetical protein